MIRRIVRMCAPQASLAAAALLASITPLSGQVPGEEADPDATGALDIVEIPAVFEADRVYVRAVTVDYPGAVALFER